MADHNLVIIGAGPAGYTAALYAARAQLAPVVFTGDTPGGQLMWTTVVENFPGFESGVMGPELMTKMREQAAHFGAVIKDETVSAVTFTKTPFEIQVGSDTVTANSIIIATGASARYLEVPGEKELLGRGVATCAVCDAPFYKDKRTIVVGGGDAAIEDALALTKFASSVALLVRGESLRASAIMKQRAETNPKIKIHYHTSITSIEGDTKVKAVSLLNNVTKDMSRMEIDGVFIAIGHVPASSLFAGQLELDAHGFITTTLTSTSTNAHETWLHAYPTATSVKGVFAAGDVVDFRYRQAITSAGMGCMAALDAQKYLESSI